MGGGADPEGYLHGIPYRKIDTGRAELLISKQDFEIAFEQHHCACTAVPVVSRNDVNIYARDVTALKRAEEELQKKSADLEMSNTALKETMVGLEAEIASRTRELVEANEKLQIQMDNVANAEVRFRAFAASAADWYWEMDRDLRFSYFSEDFECVTGVPPEQLLGKTREETGGPRGRTGDVAEAARRPGQSPTVQKLRPSPL